jgi:hypothetical protein
MLDDARKKALILKCYTATRTPLNTGSIGIDIPSVIEISNAASPISCSPSRGASALASSSAASSATSIFADTSASRSAAAGATECESGSAGDGTGDADLDLFVTVSKSFFPALPPVSVFAVLLLLPPRAFGRLLPPLPLVPPPAAALPPDFWEGLAFERLGWCLSLQSSQYQVPVGATLCPMQTRWN